MSLIGVILLMGIVAKNAILLIDFAKWGVERGMGRHEALVEAGRIRLRPILMTTLALIAGMIPVALGRGEGGGFPGAVGSRGDRWRDHVDVADAVRDSDGVRHSCGLAGGAGGSVRA